MSQLLKWNDSGLFISINDHSPYLDITAKFNSREVKLLLEYSSKSAFFEDIQGNNFDSGIHGKGVGSLLVNLALQVIKGKLPAESVVEGEMSDVGDPRESEILNNCQTHRAKFWESFGFKVMPGKQGAENIAARLSELNVKEYGLAWGKFPRYIPLNNFIVQL
jgi:hypothetical protein